MSRTIEPDSQSEPPYAGQFCCEQMREQVEYRDTDHPDPFDCSDNLVHYVAKFDEYGLIIHDGGMSKLDIGYCPWCGTALPASRRNEWFERIDALGLDPWEDELPAEYHSDAWYRNQPA